jgi:CubicO group peptidase (beta-lactamase class C family)
MTRRSKLASLGAAVGGLSWTSACAGAVKGRGPLAGRWGGVLGQGASASRLVLEIVADQPINLISIDRNNARRPATGGECGANSLDLAFDSVNGRLRLALRPPNVLAGTWEQQGQSRMIVFTRLAAGQLPIVPAVAAFGDFQTEVDRARANSSAPALAAAFGTINMGRLTTREVVSGICLQGEAALVSPGQLWHIGSITKSMTATLVARLVERGLLAWEMTLGDAFADMAPQMQSAYWNKTLSQMLTGQTGMPTNIGLPALFGHIASEESPSVGRKEWVTQALAMPPQSGFVYPNNGYVLAGALCEKVTGKAYEALMFEEVFKPLEMGTAGFGAPPLGNPQGHRKALIGGRTMAIGVARDADNPSPMSPAGRAHMSLPDLAKFALIHSQGHNGLRNDYLRQDTWQKLHTPPIKTAAGNDYAYGWVARKDGTLWHNGSNTFWLAECAFDPAKNISACACANLFDSAQAVERMLAVGLAQAAS